MSASSVPAPLARAARPLVAGALAAALCAAALTSLSVGAVLVPPADVLHVLARAADAALAGGAAEGGPAGAAARIVVDLRLPRVAAAAAGGLALGTAGLLLQALFRNPLADPWSLGLTAGAQLGAAVAAVAGAVVVAPDLVGWLRAAAGLGLVAGAAAGTAAVAVAMAALARRLHAVTLLVVGLMLGFLAQGLMSVLLHLTNRAQGRIFASWNDGTFAGLTWADLGAFLAPVAAGLALAWALAKPLSALLLGETYAASVGVEVPRLRRLALLAAVLLAAPVTAYCGPVIFVGLIAPHVARGVLRTAALRPLLPVAGLAGALLAVAADLVVHLPWEQHLLHLNAVLAVLGAPFVIALLVRRGRAA